MDIYELKKQSNKIRKLNPTNKSVFWPKKFKEQTLELINNGHSANTINKFTGISVSTIYSWQASKRSKNFKPVKVVEQKTKELSLFWDNGLRVEGLSFSEFTDLLQKGLL